MQLTWITDEATITVCPSTFSSFYFLQIRVRWGKIPAIICTSQSDVGLHEGLGESRNSDLGKILETHQGLLTKLKSEKNSDIMFETFDVAITCLMVSKILILEGFLILCDPLDNIKY